MIIQNSTYYYELELPTSQLLTHISTQYLHLYQLRYFEIFEVLTTSATFHWQLALFGVKNMMAIASNYVQWYNWHKNSSQKLQKENCLRTTLINSSGFLTAAVRYTGPAVILQNSFILSFTDLNNILVGSSAACLLDLSGLLLLAPITQKHLIKL